MIVVLFLFSSAKRHTRCALVIGVQTCAHPISADTERGLTRRAAVERALENAFEKGIEPGILVVPDREDRRRDQDRPRERRRSDEVPPSDHACPPLPIHSSMRASSSGRGSGPPPSTRSLKRARSWPWPSK